MASQQQQTAGVNESGGKTLRDLMLEVGLPLGLVSWADATDENAGQQTIPTDPADRAMLTMIVNGGYKRFLSANGGAWSFLRPVLRVSLRADGLGPTNIDHDPSRYRLPGWATGRPLHDWTYADEINTRHYGTITDRTEDDVRRQRSLSAGNTGLNAPRIAAMRSRGDGSRELVLWPAPTFDADIETQIRITPADLRSLDDRPVSPPEHDQTIVYCCLVYSQVLRPVLDAQLVRRWRDECDRALADSIAIDASDSTPTNLGRLSPPTLNAAQAGDTFRSFGGDVSVVSNTPAP